MCNVSPSLEELEKVQESLHTFLLRKSKGVLRTVAKWSQRNRDRVSDHPGVLFSPSREQLPLNHTQKLHKEFLNQADIPTPLQWAPRTKAPLTPQISSQGHLREVGCPQEEHGLTARSCKEQGV